MASPAALLGGCGRWAKTITAGLRGQAKGSGKPGRLAAAGWGLPTHMVAAPHRGVSPAPHCPVAGSAHSVKPDSPLHPQAPHSSAMGGSPLCCLMLPEPCLIVTPHGAGVSVSSPGRLPAQLLTPEGSQASISLPQREASASAGLRPGWTECREGFPAPTEGAGGWGMPSTGPAETAADWHSFAGLPLWYPLLHLCLLRPVCCGCDDRGKHRPLCT